MSGRVFPIEGRAVVLTGSAIDAVLYAVNIARARRLQLALEPSSALELLARQLSPSGQADIPGGPVEQAESMTINEAAERLGMSPRHVRRLAARLGGRRMGGRWLLDRRAVAEHIEGGSL